MRRCGGGGMRRDMNDVIEGKIDIITRNLEFLNDYRFVDEEEFLNSYKDVQAVKYSLVEIMEAMESCIDIASHIISAKYLLEDSKERKVMLRCLKYL
jgi:uncharacterized protein YutE (UPF0331/DUF86 family)